MLAQAPLSASYGTEEMRKPPGGGARGASSPSDGHSGHSQIVACVPLRPSGADGGSRRFAPNYGKSNFEIIFPGKFEDSDFPKTKSPISV